MKQPEQSYTAIETAHGFVFFTDTTEGQKNRQDFLQFMADHYFDPHFNLGPVNVYRAEGVLKDGSYVNPGEGLYPEYAYLQMDKTPEMELVYRNEMKPTWEDFGSFCHNMHCTSSHRNRNIADILPHPLPHPVALRGVAQQYKGGVPIGRKEGLNLTIKNYVIFSTSLRRDLE